MGNSVQTNSNQADLSTLNASNLSSGTVNVARLGSGTASSSTFLRGDNSWQTITSVGGNTGVDFNDNIKARFGTANEIELQWNTTGDYFYLGSKAGVEKDFISRFEDYEFLTGPSTGSKKAIKIVDEAQVELYHNDSKRLETKTWGIELPSGSSLIARGTGYLKVEDNGKFYAGSNEDLTISHNGTNSVIANNTGILQIAAASFRVNNAANDEVQIKAIENSGVELYFNDSKKFETTNTGVTVTGTAIATTFSGSGASLTSLNATNLGSGTVPTARLGSGTASSSTFLRGDGSWQVVGTGTGESYVKLFSSGSLSNSGNSTVAGYLAGANLAGDYNTLFGMNAGNAVTSGTRNTFVGFGSGLTATTGGYNSCFGFNAGETITSGTQNIAIGVAPMGSGACTGSQNIGIGEAAAKFLTSGQNNVVLGQEAGAKLTSGNYNIALGKLAGWYIQTSDHNIALGENTIAGSSTFSGSHNIALGKSGLHTLTSGSENLGIGYEAGYYLTTGSYNVLLGHEAGNQLTTGSNNIVIGKDAAASSATVSNQITFGDTNITKFRIPGINFVLKDNQGTPSSGQVLTADGSGEGYWASMSASNMASGGTFPAINGSNLTNLPASAPQITATASGSIAAKDPLIINSSGQATKIVKSITQQTPAVSGSPSVIQTSTGANGSCIMYVPSIDRWFCAYMRSSYIRGKMGRSLSGNAITWGSEIAISGSNGSHPQCCFDLSANVPVFVWKNNSNTTPYCRPMGINTSTDTMSHGTQFQIGTNASEDINIVYDPSAQRCVMAWTQSNDASAVCKYIDVSSATSATVTPSASSYGTYLTGSSSYPDCRSQHFGLCYDPDQQACIAFLRRTAGTHDGKTGVVKITTPSSGTSAQTVSSVYHWIPANSYVPTSFACDYDEKENRVVTSYTNSATSYANIQIAVGQWNGSLYGMGTNHSNSVNTTNHAIAATYDPTAERVVVAWGETSGPKIKSFTIGGSGYSVTESSIGELENGSDELPPGFTGSRTALAYHATSGGCLMIFKDEGNSNYFSTKFVTSAIPSTNLNTGNFAGFANNSIGSGGSVTINVVGATTSWTATSLTPGTGYFVQADGTLGTSADVLSGSVSAGLALTSSSLLIK